ncbi:MAG: hypothetical protein IT385_14030 [Deltaproteobacteria bacterium]|nr:hypothetical protein [Deltaproteobacteria bacterium]
MKLVARLVASVLALVTSSTLAPTASADPTLRDLLAETSRSIQEVNEATVRVVQARKAYDDQLEVVRAAAAEVARIFASEPAATPAPANPLIRSLLLPATPKLAGHRLQALRLGARLPLVEPLVKPSLFSVKPTSRLAALLAFEPSPKKDLFALRAADPSGTSIYDSLTFAKK